MALVITRDKGRSFTIGDHIKITVVDIYEINGHPQTKIAIEAPKEIIILRDDAKKITKHF